MLVEWCVYCVRYANFNFYTVSYMYIHVHKPVLKVCVLVKRCERDCYTPSKETISPSIRVHTCVLLINYIAFKLSGLLGGMHMYSTLINNSAQLVINIINNCTV